MASRLLPRSFQPRLATLAPSRSISSSSARAARRQRRPTNTTAPRTSSRTTQPPPPPPPTSSKPPHRGTGSGPQHNAASASASASASAGGTTSRLLDPDDPLNLKKTRPADDDEPVIRFFEQDISEMGKSAPRPVSRARMAADERAAEALWKKIAKLEREIADIEGGDDAELDATLMRLRAIDRGERDPGKVEWLAEAEPEAVRADLEALRVPGEEVAGKEGKAVATLNNCLRHAFLATQPKKRPVLRQELWKAYKRAKLYCPGVLRAIPDPAWDMLFYSQAVRWKSNERREEHLAELLEDMKSVGMDGPPTPPPDRKEEDFLVDLEEALEFSGNRYLRRTD